MQGACAGPNSNKNGQEFVCYFNKIFSGVRSTDMGMAAILFAKCNLKEVSVGNLKSRVFNQGLQAHPW